jgi:hypothetical protein
MDTNELEPVGGQDVSSSQDTSEIIAQPTESEEIVDGNQSEDVEEAPELLAGKYKTQEDLIKAHQELEKKLGEQGQKAELANLLEKQTGMNASQIKEYLAQQQYAQYEAQVQGNPGLAAYQEVQSLKSQIALQNEEKELNTFLSSEEGKPYADFKDKILNLGLNLEKDKTYSEIAKEYFGQSRAQGQQDAYKKIEKKIMTQSTGVSQTPAKGKFTEADMEKMSVAELEAILPHADTSERMY